MMVSGQDDNQQQQQVVSLDGDPRFLLSLKPLRTDQGLNELNVTQQHQVEQFVTELMAGGTGRCL